jgi:predicted RNA-binding Zn-ribbon protein involved in translation (DUF1610 family)
MESIYHEAKMERVKPFALNLRYGYKNYSALFKCPVCGREIWQSLNYASGHDVMCINGKRKLIKK